MKALLIVYHSMTDGTRQMAHAAAAGAGEERDIAVSVLRADEARAKDVLAADGYIFATPENLAAMSGLMKDFFDRTYYAVLDRINGRPYAALICAGSDGRNAAQQIERIAAGWRSESSDARFGESPILKSHVILDGCAHPIIGELKMARKYSKGSEKKVEKVMRERKAGTLRSGRSGKQVTSRKQAIAIGLSEARRAGKKVPKKKAA